MGNLRVGNLLFERVDGDLVGRLDQVDLLRDEGGHLGRPVEAELDRQAVEVGLAALPVVWVANLMRLLLEIARLDLERARADDHLLVRISAFDDVPWSDMDVER